jgi:hypothetical protein
MSRTAIINSLCCAIGVMLAYDIPWFYRACEVLPPFIMEIWRCLEIASR